MLADLGGSVVDHPLQEREVLGSNPGCAIPKALKMVPVATLLGAQHYKASTGFSSYKYSATITSQRLQKSLKRKFDNNQCLYLLEDLMEDWQSC